MKISYTSVAQYETDDGRIFGSEEEAAAHEAILNKAYETLSWEEIRNALCVNTPRGWDIAADDSFLRKVRECLFNQPFTK